MTISGAIFYTQNFGLQVNGNFKIKNYGSYYTDGTNNTAIHGNSINFDNAFNTAFNNLTVGRTGNVNITGNNTNIPIGGNLIVGSGTNLNVGVDTLTIATNV
ncbi:MAG: hypothetical protein Q8880_13650, partial [Bacteroidota bacterium]|nr:hypothetical protein [Bacteroidota bacterium]